MFGVLNGIHASLDECVGILIQYKKHNSYIYIKVVHVTCITIQMTTGRLGSIHILNCFLNVPIYDRLPYTMVPVCLI